MLRILFPEIGEVFPEAFVGMYVRPDQPLGWLVGQDDNAFGSGRGGAAEGGFAGPLDVLVGVQARERIVIEKEDIQVADGQAARAFQVQGNRFRRGIEVHFIRASGKEEQEKRKHNNRRQTPPVPSRVDGCNRKGDWNQVSLPGAVDEVQKLSHV